MATPVLLTRADWTTHDPVRALTRMVRDAVEGSCIHWPGTTSPIGDAGRARTAARLEGYRRFHVAPEPAGRGWSDIAYQVAFDQGGRVWPLRGLEYESAANGTSDLNDRYVAALFLVGPGERPSAALLDSWRWYRSEHILARYPRATRVVGHGQVRPGGSDCPGDRVLDLIVDGELSRPWTPATPPPGDAYLFTLHRFLLRGIDGADVAQWQRRCNAIVPGAERDTKVDGDFGEDTERLTKVVQRRLGVADDGIVGPVTAERARVRWAGPR